MGLDPDAHLKDPDLYRRYYEGDPTPGVFVAMRPDEPRLRWVWPRVGPADDVLDLGCHKGEMTVYLRGRTTGRVVGVDISEAALKDAKHFHGRRPIEWLRAEAEAVPLPNNSFDVAVLCEILEHVPDADAVLREAERLVRPGGRVLLSVPVDAIEMGAAEVDEREQATGLHLNAHVREFVPAEALAGKPDLEVGEGAVAAVGFRWRFAAYRVEK